MSTDAPPPPPTVPALAAGAPPARRSAGDPELDRELDDELAAFVRRQRPRRSVHPVRVVLAVAATFAVLWILVPTTDELAFHLSRQAAPTDLLDGSAPVLARVPDGTWARVNVVLGNKAAEIPEWRKGSLRMGPIEVREVVGAPLFIEFDPKAWPDLDPFVQTDVEGRLVSFGPDSELGEVRGYFSDRLRAPVPATARALIVGERPGGQPQYLTAWIGGVALLVLSWTSVLRRLLGPPST
ncbi:MAG: hypothetical protein FJ137_14585 [Deltaproteobacteria bacterium]|nr:hypothetical protein [Deltaproteobacteria bacterium]